MQILFSTNRCQYKLIKLKYLMTGLKQTLEKHTKKPLQHACYFSDLFFFSISICFLFLYLSSRKVVLKPILGAEVEKNCFLTVICKALSYLLQRECWNRASIQYGQCTAPASTCGLCSLKILEHLLQFSHQLNKKSWFALDLFMFDFPETGRVNWVIQMLIVSLHNLSF